MSFATTAWKAVDAARALDMSLTRRSDRRTILIDSRTAMNFVMAAPIQTTLSADPRVEFYATSTEAPDQVAAIYHGAPRTVRLVSPRRASFMRFDAYLTADLLWARLPRGVARIQMFHGVAGKYTHDYDTPESSMRRWHRLFFVNRRRMQNFIAAGAIDASSDAPRLIGMPKVDCLVDGSLRRDAVLRRLRLDPAKPTILYAPTWSAASSLNSMGEEVIKGLLARDWNVVVKLHDRSRDPRPFYSGGVDWVGRLTALMAGKPAHLVSDADICPYLTAADVMISDHSSAAFEYLILDRPLVRIHVPELLKTANTNQDYVRLLADAARSVTSPTEVLWAVEAALADPAAGSAARRAVAEDLFHEPGTATTRAVAELYRVMELTPAASLASTLANRATVAP